MQKFSSPSQDVANKRFWYDPESGQLHWKAPPEGSSAKPHHIRAWNTRFKDQPAGHVHTCTVGKKYVQVRMGRSLYYAHRIIWSMHHGEPPEDMQIDHIDGDGTNNRLYNLRLVDATEQKRNVRRLATNTSGYNGVYWDKKRDRWYAKGWLDDKAHHLGYADSFEGAVRLRQDFDRRHGFHESHGMERAL